MLLAIASPLDEVLRAPMALARVDVVVIVVCRSWVVRGDSGTYDSFHNGFIS